MNRNEAIALAERLDTIARGVPEARGYGLPVNRSKFVIGEIYIEAREAIVDAILEATSSPAIPDSSPEVEPPRLESFGRDLLVQELAMTVRLLCRQLNLHDPGNKLAQAAMADQKRHGLTSPLRDGKGVDRG